MSEMVPEEDLAIAHLEQERLEAEVARLREALRQLDFALAELQALRAAIEKLRDGLDERFYEWLIFRLTEILEGES